MFKVVTPTQRTDVRMFTDVQAYLQSVTLEALLAQLKDKGITQKAFAEQLGMHPRHLAAIKSNELRHHYFNELGATTLACAWMLEHLGKTKRR
ncbi:MAG TPA: helix-turn-helix transcriptional regulator [Candidatus Tectomicrobia bacterium]